MKVILLTINGVVSTDAIPSPGELWIGVPGDCKLPDYLEEKENSILRIENFLPDDWKIVYVGNFPLKELSEKFEQVKADIERINYKDKVS